MKSSTTPSLSSLFLAVRDVLPPSMLHGGAGAHTAFQRGPVSPACWSIENSGVFKNPHIADQHAGGIAIHTPSLACQRKENATCNRRSVRKYGYHNEVPGSLVVTFSTNARLPVLRSSVDRMNHTEINLRRGYMANRTRLRDMTPDEAMDTKIALQTAEQTIDAAMADGEVTLDEARAIQREVRRASVEADETVAAAERANIGEKLMLSMLKDGGPNPYLQRQAHEVGLSIIIVPPAIQASAPTVAAVEAD